MFIQIRILLVFRRTPAFGRYIVGWGVPTSSQLRLHKSTMWFAIGTPHGAHMHPLMPELLSALQPANDLQSWRGVPWELFNINDHRSLRSSEVLANQSH